MPSRGRPRIIQSPEEEELLRQRKNERQRQWCLEKKLHQTSNEQLSCEQLSQQEEQLQILQDQRNNHIRERYHSNQIFRERHNQCVIQSRLTRQLTQTPEQNETLRIATKSTSSSVEMQDINYQIDNLRHIRNDDTLSNADEHYLGQMDVKCIHCNANHFVEEKVHNKSTQQTHLTIVAIMKKSFLKRIKTINSY